MEGCSLDFKMKNALLFLSILILGFSNSFCQENDTIKGFLVWNLTDFEGFYGVPDSVIDKYLAYLKLEDPSIDEKIECLEESKLLYKPCEVIYTSKEERVRVFFELEEDYQKIKDSGWFNIQKTKSKHTYIECVVQQTECLKKTVICHQLISIQTEK